MYSQGIHGGAKIPNQQWQLSTAAENSGTAGATNIALKSDPTLCVDSSLKLSSCGEEGLWTVRI